MRRFRFSISLLLCIAVFASVFSSFAALAAPLKPPSLDCSEPPAKLANLSVTGIPRQQNVDCCLFSIDKIASSTHETKLRSAALTECCAPIEVTLKAAKTQIGARVAQSNNCCDGVIIEIPDLRGKTTIGSHRVQADPCAPVVDSSCGISYPAGSVVGEIPFDQQAYYAPGLAAAGVTINAGTYWVTGLGKADNGDGYYQIVVACQYLFVPESDVIPSYQAPWSGQPLPTTPPVEG